MREFAAIIPFILLMVLDALILAACICIIGLVLIDMANIEYPMSYHFIKKVFRV